MICAIDPGLKGALVFLDSLESMKFHEMPLNNNEPHYLGIRSVLAGYFPSHIFLERAMPMAMGAKHAFNYGRGFAAIEIAIINSLYPVTYVEPAKWMKAMHEGTDARLKPKERSKIALERLAPKLYKLIPKGKTGKPHEGIVDAALLGVYGLKQASLPGQKLSSPK